MIFEDFIEIISRIRCTHTLHAMCEELSLKYLRERLKIREIKDPIKFSAIRYVSVQFHIHADKQQPEV